MRFLVVSDIQADDGSARCFHDPSVPLQRWRVQKLYNLLARLTTKYGCDGIIDAGDLTDNRKQLTLSTIDFVLGALEPFKGKVNYKVVGNHCQYAKSSEITTSRMFQPIFDVECRTGVRALKDGSGWLLLASFPAEGEDIIESIRRCKKQVTDDKPVFCIGHFTVAGASLNSGIAEHGANREYLSSFKLTLLGDIHKAQTLAPNVFYIGSPFQQDFGEAGQEKRIALLDTGTGTVQWIALGGFPKYYTVSLDEFERQVQPDSEDRYRVALRSTEEATRYYAHALAHRAEASFQFNAAEAQTTLDKSYAEHDWSIRAAVEKYVQAVPPAARDLEISEKELADFGVEIAGL